MRASTRPSCALLSANIAFTCIASQAHAGPSESGIRSCEMMLFPTHPHPGTPLTKILSPGETKRHSLSIPGSSQPRSPANLFAVMTPKTPLASQACTFSAGHDDVVIRGERAVAHSVWLISLSPHHALSSPASAAALDKEIVVDVLCTERLCIGLDLVIHLRVATASTITTSTRTQSSSVYRIGTPRRLLHFHAP